MKREVQNVFATGFIKKCRSCSTAALQHSLEYDSKETLQTPVIHISPIFV